MTTSNEWELEFDKLFVEENYWKSDNEDTAFVAIDRIKSFITQELLTTLDSIRAEVERMKRYPGKSDDYTSDAQAEAVNDTLSDIITFLDSEKAKLTDGRSGN